MTFWNVFLFFYVDRAALGDVDDFEDVACGNVARPSQRVGAIDESPRLYAFRQRAEMLRYPLFSHQTPSLIRRGLGSLPIAGAESCLCGVKVFEVLEAKVLLLGRQALAFWHLNNPLF